ncbi:PREDICTED: uncharacterized protein LOC108558118 [Nicrophorus vespilloides]|uniref:Uncharacterized protein LOC108558118 n=1 Tax=Nicrophorus vespilloides TaxID=110193 RepID=A0ABM1M766_NICVS|nr:PREDICTED: uncharacterized protein LOC108558118 [Nicrophorus vespilloides]
MSTARLFSPNFYKYTRRRTMSSEIQCNNITSSKKNKRTTKAVKHSKSLDAIKKIITETSDIENCPNTSDKTAILKLVKRNLQKMCLTKSGPQTEIVALHDNILSNNSDGATNIIQVFRYENRSRSTKELLRKTILERRKCSEYDNLHADYMQKQKIWRPW